MKKENSNINSNDKEKKSFNIKNPFKKSFKAENEIISNEDNNKTRILPKVKEAGQKLENNSRIFSEKYFVYDNKPTNFFLAIAVTTMKMFFVFLAIFAIAGIGAILGVASAYVETSPIVDTATLTDISKTSLVYDMNGEEIAKYTGAENRIWVKLEDVPQVIKDAFISIEDTRFYSHEGIDYKRLFGAFVGNLQSSNIQGGSTISQQLVKLRMLTSERSYKRKIQEAYMTMVLESKYSKDQILESYLNTILLGSNNYGIQAAANDYFDKDVKDLTLREAAMLAGITQTPNKFNPRTNYYVKDTPEVINDRTDVVLRSMYTAGRITTQEYEDALKEEVNIVQFSNTKSDHLNYAYFIEYAINDITDQLIQQRGLDDNKATRSEIENELRTNGYKIYLTIDKDIQNTVQQSLSNWTKYPKTQKSSDSTLTEIVGDTTIQHEQPEASAVIYDYKTGEYRAIVGGRNVPTAEKIINRAYQTTHSVGSSIKPITVYGPALDKGMNPSSLINNTKTAIPGWGTSKGYPEGGGPEDNVTMRQAIVSSMNRAAARTLMTRVGIDDSAQYLLDMGVKESQINRDGSGLALGTSAITPLQMSACFGTIANNGEYIKPTSFTKVVDGDGNVIIDAKANQEESKKQVYKKSTAYQLTSMLIDAVKSGTGSSANISGMTVAGKTGTNNDYKGIGFSGYTPYYSATVFIGHDKNAALKNAYAGSYAAPLWKDFMSKIHQGLPNKSIIDSNITEENSERVTLCVLNDKLATDACNADIQGNTPISVTMAKEDIPTESCDAHYSVSICSDSNHSTNEYCPSDKKINVTLIKKTNEVSDSIVSSYQKSVLAKYPNFDINTKCSIHNSATDNTTETTTAMTNNNLTTSRYEASELVKKAYEILTTKKDEMTSQKYSAMLKAYNNLNNYYMENTATADEIKNRIEELKQFVN